MDTRRSVTVPVKAVVFDLDGLMFNTEDVFDAAGTELLRRRGLEMTSEIRTLMMGRRAEEAFQLLVEATGMEESVAELMTESQVIFNELLDGHLRPMPGLFDFLDFIERCGRPKAVATSSGRTYLQEMLNRFELAERFQLTLTAEDVSRGKPHPEIYLTAAERLDVAPSEMLVLEDSGTGTQAAAAAQAVVVSIPHEHSREHDFSGAAYIARSLDDPQLRRLLAG